MQHATFIGVDVGTGSARAGLFDATGRLLATARHPIALWQESGGIAEQSSDDIWAACATAVRQAVERAGVSAATVRGIGFDATCSLVVLDSDGVPLPVGASGDPARNVIVWMDHRAIAEARDIDATRHPVLDHVGGSISPEMQTPKLLWLKRHLPATFRSAGHFFDLADYLTWRATGSLARSGCTVTCKWTYAAHERRWRDDFFAQLGLEDLSADDHRRIGSEIVDPGMALGAGLTERAAEELGLTPGTPVGAALIDAHAGGIGTLGGRGPEGEEPSRSGRLAYIMGTSACIMATTPDPVFVPGIWGPYFSAMVPGSWLNEGGQSAAGAAIDHLVQLHPAHGEASRAASERGLGLLEFLEHRILASAPDASEAAIRAHGLHILPDLLGNRSPNADPDARAAILGLEIERGIEGLEQLYLAALCGLGYGAAQVVEAFRAKGIECEMLVMSGGAARSPLVRQIMADATGCAVAHPASPEPVLLGAAMLGAQAGGAFPSLSEAMAAMSRIESVVRPAGGRIAAFHRAKRTIYDRLQLLDREARILMEARG